MDFLIKTKSFLKSIITFISSSIVLLVALILLIAWILGIRHAVNKHGTLWDYLAIFPPVGWYFAIESFSCSVDKEELEIKLETDCIRIVAIFNYEAFGIGDYNKINEAKSALKNNIENYSIDNINYLKDFTNQYVNFYICTIEKASSHIINKYLSKDPLYIAIDKNTSFLQYQYKECEHFFNKYPFFPKFLDNTKYYENLSLDKKLDELFKNNKIILSKENIDLINNELDSMLRILKHKFNNLMASFFE